MGIIEALLEKGERREYAEDDDYWYQPRYSPSLTGQEVGPTEALGTTAIWNAVTLISGTIGMLPLKLYRRRKDGGKEPAREHPTFWVVHRQPNPWQSAIEFREMMQGHLLLRGNAYAQIVKNNAGHTIALVPLHPDRTEVKVENGRIVYKFHRDGKWIDFKPEEIYHLRGLSSNGIVGYSPITLMREAVGLTIAGEKYGAKFYGSDASSRIALKTEQSLSQEAQDRLKKNWRATYAGESGWHETAVLEEGLDIAEIGFSPEDAEFVASRTFQVLEVARMFNIPPHKIRELTRATFSNIEHQAIEYLVDTIQPWAERWEQRADLALLTPQEQQDHFFKFSMTALLRGDNKSRAEYYRQMWGIGAFSINDILELEDRNPVDGGDDRFVPLNMIPVEQAGEMPKLPARELPDGQHRQIESREWRSLILRQRYQNAYRKVLTEAGARIVRREVGILKRAIKSELGKRSIPGLQDKIRGIYEKHGKYITEQLMGVLLAYAEVIQAAAVEEVGANPIPEEDRQQFVQQYAENIAKRHNLSSERQLAKIINDNPEPEELEAALTTRLDEWEEKRPDKIGARESVQAGGAFAKMAFAAVGVTVLRWRALGDACDFCQQLDGKTVSVLGNFMEAGQSLEVEGESPLTFEHNLGHPPAHAFCGCMVSAG